MNHFSGDINYSRPARAGYSLLAAVPALWPYFVERQGLSLHVQFSCAYLDSHNYLGLHYVQVVQCPGIQVSIWHSRSYWQPSLYFRYQLKYHCPSCKDLEKYVDHTSHTSNDVLSAQADCPADLSLDEFIAFAHLRSGGSLQWLNILQALRSRSLNFRRHQVYYLLAHAAFQVGPLDPETGEWTWHQELQDSSFCNDLLDELNCLFADVGARSVDAMLMNTISLLLTRVLASSPSEGVSDRAVALLRGVRRKTFGWVQDLSYNLAQAPTNEERRDLLLDMAITCRSTFDVDPGALRKVCYSAEDVDVLLSCGFFIHALHREGMSNCPISRIFST